MHKTNNHITPWTVNQDLFKSETPYKLLKFNDTHKEYMSDYLINIYVNILSGKHDRELMNEHRCIIGYYISWVHRPKQDSLLLITILYRSCITRRQQ